MEYFDVIRARHSVRAFTGQPVEPDKLQAILEAVNTAPSAGDLQGYEVYLVTDPSAREALAQAAHGQEFVAQAPVNLVFCTHAALSAARYGKRGSGLYTLQDATIACTYAMLAATALGLASVWVGAFSDDAAWRAIGSPDGIKPVAILPIGYAAEQPGPSPRRPLNEWVHRV